MMTLITKLKIGTVVLLASCTIATLTTISAAPPQEPAGADGGVRGKDRICMPDGVLMYVNIYSIGPDAHEAFLHNHAIVNILPEISRVRGVGSAAMLCDRRVAVRIHLNPERMRANNLSPEDIVHNLIGCTAVGGSARQAKENVLTYIGGRYSKPEEYENIILKASPDGDILRLKDVCAVGAGTQSCIDADINGHPSAAIVLRQVPGFNSGEVIEAVKRKLEEIKKVASLPGKDGFEQKSARVVAESL
jgi:HAE1 family hydrophobic/amphiphilic exporter-1